MHRLLALVLSALLGALVTLTPGAAQAHDELLSTDPADGATVAAPEELRLHFSGEIAQIGAALVVNAPDGSEVADGDPQVQGTDLVQPLSDAPAGDYEVVWRVTSSDGHPISGSFGFTVEGDGEGTGAGGDVATEEQAAEEGTEEGTDEATQDAATDAATEEAAQDAPQDTATDDATSGDTAQDTADQQAGSGLPLWLWAVLGIVVLALLALLARTWSRGRR